MNYKQTIAMENVTLQDCIDLYEKKNTVTIINDGKVIDFEKENK